MLTSPEPVYVKLFAVPSKPSGLVLYLLGTVKLIIRLLAILSTICGHCLYFQILILCLVWESNWSPPEDTCLLSVASPISPAGEES